MNISASPPHAMTSPGENMIPVPGGALATPEQFGEVKLAAIAVGKYPVTLGKWKSVCASVEEKGYDIKKHGAGSGIDHPVHSVSWYDALKWCNALSEMLGLPPVYTVDGMPYRSGEDVPAVVARSNGFRLPTQAEWEWAARGGKKSRGFTYSGSNLIGEVAWYSVTSAGAVLNMSKGHGTRPVGQKAPNELGLYDMTGNVWEWCHDAWGESRIIRGGGWADSAAVCPISCRRDIPPAHRFYDIGFRPVRSWEIHNPDSPAR
jgi:formylglycine-generating enzyme required for sulfatase activity